MTTGGKGNSRKGKKGLTGSLGWDRGGERRWSGAFYCILAMSEPGKKDERCLRGADRYEPQEGRNQ